MLRRMPFQPPRPALKMWKPVVSVTVKVMESVSVPIVFDSYLEEAFENHRRPRKDAQRVLYFDITFDNYRFGIPNT